MQRLSAFILAGVVFWPSPAGAAADCRPEAFGGARVLRARLAVRMADPGTTPAPRAEARGDFDRVLAGILGIDPRDDDRALRGFEEGLASGTDPLPACDASVLARDRLAYRLASVGYSAGAIARMLLGESSRQRIDAAYARRMAGYGEIPERPLDRLPAAPAQTVVAVARPPMSPARQLTSAVRRVPTPADVDAHIRRYAQSYQVDHRLVYAIIRQESNWAAAAVSPKGARGLMQLMPATARMLGVDPDDPLDNIRGGIAFLADLLQSYGNVRDALIAYNAGPTHANRVLRGERALYGETRRYLDAIGRSYPLGASPDLP